MELELFAIVNNLFESWVTRRAPPYPILINTRLVERMATHEVDSWEGQGLLTLLTVGFVKGQCCCFHLDEFFLVISDLTPRIDHFLLLLLDSDYLFGQLQFEKGLEHPKPQTVFLRQNLQNRRRRQHIHLPNIRQSFFDESLTLVLILNVSEIGQGLDPQF